MEMQCEDLLILWEMEHNGLSFNEDKARSAANATRARLVEIDAELANLAGTTDINWNSDDHISAVLYGGDLPISGRVPTTRVLKNGTVKHGEKNGWITLSCERLVEPLPRSETKPTVDWSDEQLSAHNEGREKRVFRVYSVSEPTLRSLKARGKARSIIQLLLERAKLDKLHSTYYRGLPELIEEMDWPSNTLHGQFNQCVAVTGRLSSSKPVS